jgi:hypothetical protein
MIGSCGGDAATMLRARLGVLPPAQRRLLDELGGGRVDPGRTPEVAPLPGGIVPW